MLRRLDVRSRRVVLGRNVPGLRRREPTVLRGLDVLRGHELRGWNVCGVWWCESTVLRREQLHGWDDVFGRHVSSVRHARWNLLHGSIHVPVPLLQSE
jgi:hypothetical protein